MYIYINYGHSFLIKVRKQFGHLNQNNLSADLRSSNKDLNFPRSKLFIESLDAYLDLTGHERVNFVKLQKK